MRAFAIILNVLLLIAVNILVVDEAEPALEFNWDFVLFALLILTPVFTLLALCLTEPVSLRSLSNWWHRRAMSDWWLPLYLKRKAAEERRRIKDLESSTDSKSGGQ
jgi:hypothetical protein